jgi:dGTPase
VASTNAAIETSGASASIDIQRLDHNVVAWSPEFSRENHEMRALLRVHLYHHPRVAHMAARADKIIGDLYSAFIKTPKRLPASSAKHIRVRGLERTVCDYIAGMTDRFALDEHAKLHGEPIAAQETRGDTWGKNRPI